MQWERRINHVWVWTIFRTYHRRHQETTWRDPVLCGEAVHVADLSLVALWLLVTPMSSTPSEHNLSFLNRLLTADRNCLKDDILEDIILVKSFFDFTPRMEDHSRWWDGALQQYHPPYYPQAALPTQPPTTFLGSRVHVFEEINTNWTTVRQVQSLSPEVGICFH